MPGARARRFTFTIFNEQLVGDPEHLLDHGADGAGRDKSIRYLVWQLERAPDTGRLHIQGYIRVDNTCTFGTIKNILHCPDAHIEIARGTEAENKTYCTKPDSRVNGPWELGSPMLEGEGQGKRKDLDEMTEAIKNGKDMIEVAELHPASYVRNYRGLGEYRSLQLNQHNGIREPLKVAVVVGATGVGKSYWAWTTFPSLYSVNWPASTSHVFWWDGYTGQQFVLFDEFDAQIPLATLLKYLDRYPLTLRTTTTGFVPARYTHVIITTNRPIDEWYGALQPDPRQIEALHRRITIEITVNSREEMLTAIPELDKAMEYLPESPRAGSPPHSP